MADGFDWSSFVEIPGFGNRWDAIGGSDADLRILQLQLLAAPTRGPVVPGAGGWRKIRFAMPSSGRGKSGGIRVYYADLPKSGIILLGTAFSKVEMADLGRTDKKLLGELLAEYRRLFEEGL